MKDFMYRKKVKGHLHIFLQYGGFCFNMASKIKLTEGVMDISEK